MIVISYLRIQCAESNEYLLRFKFDMNFSQTIVFVDLAMTDVTVFRLNILLLLVCALCRHPLELGDKSRTSTSTVSRDACSSRSTQFNVCGATE